MRSMTLELFAQSPVLMLPVIALVIFIVIFGGAAVRVWRRGAAGWSRSPTAAGSPRCTSRRDRFLP